jgi:hypothetical protein
MSDGQKQEDRSVTSAIALFAFVVTLALGTAAGAAAGRSAHPDRLRDGDGGSVTPVTSILRKQSSSSMRDLLLGYFTATSTSPQGRRVQVRLIRAAEAAIKAALAAAFVYHELKLACQDANSPPPVFRSLLGS